MKEMSFFLWMLGVLIVTPGSATMREANLRVKSSWGGGEAQPRESETNEARATSNQPRCLLYSWTSTLVSQSVHYCLRLFELGCYLWPKDSSLINSNSFFRSQRIGTSFKMPSLSCQFGRKAYPSCGQLLSHCIMALSRHGYLLHQTGP